MAVCVCVCACVCSCVCVSRRGKCPYISELDDTVTTRVRDAVVNVKDRLAVVTNRVTRQHAGLVV